MRRHFSAAALVVALAVTGCSGGDDDQSLPEAGALLSAAADEMAQLETVAFRLATDTDLADLPVREVDGVITRAGDAEGTAQVEQLGQRLELQFVVVEDTFYYQLIGGWQEIPLADASQFYDPSAILHPERGMAQLLRTATDPEVVRRDGDRYEVTATFGADAMGALLPGTGEQTRGTVWIGVERPLLHRASFPVPAAGDGEPGTVTVELSEFNQPASISAP